MTGRRVETRMNEFPNDNPTFEQSLAELEQIVHDLEDGQLGLEEALGRYEKGVGLLKRCYGQLREAEQRILLLSGLDAEGQPITQPFEHTATAEIARGEPKRRRKKSDEPEIPF
jgi:exodeoxyribonuclease VII small subunit